MDSQVSKITRVPLREVWKHEAYDFTRWLQNNIDVLSEVIDLPLDNVDREQSTGSFNVDLVAEEESGGTVIIENQLGKSDHDHLGKLITYLTGLEARAAVWIVSNPRPEHIAAVAWLNESSSADFYMIKLEAIRIDESPAAPLLTLIVGPSEEVKDVGVAKKEIAERYTLRKRWWTTLIERSTAKSKLHAHLTPGAYSWLGTSAGFRGLSFNYVVTQNECGAELYIDCGKDRENENKNIFDQLAAHKDEIEGAFDGPLSWERLEGKRACRIRYTSEAGGYRSPEDQWPTIQDQIIDAMVRLERALRPYIAKLRETP